MPRIESDPSSSGAGWSIPWKAIAALAIVVCACGYGWYQYERLRPNPTRFGPTNPGKDQRVQMTEMFRGLDLSTTQSQAISTLVIQTTSTAALYRGAVKVLDPAQRRKADEWMKQARAERQKARTEARARADARKQKYYPGASAEVAKQGDQQIREDRARRKAAADAAKAAKAGASPAAATPAPVAP